MKGVLYRVLNKVFTLFNILAQRTKVLSKEDVIALYSDEKKIEILNRMQNKNCVNVAFFCMSIPLWKYDTIFKAMLQDKHYNPIIFIAPRIDSWEKRKREIQQMKEYCLLNNFQYVSLKSELFNVGQDIRKYNIDIAFYTQPYYGAICKEYDFHNLSNTLLCYVPYAFLISKESFCYNTLLESIAWKNFFSSSVNLDVALELSSKLTNIEISGYPGYDMYIESNVYEWKCPNLKKIIWAPHHSIEENGWVTTSCFLDICDYMFELAENYKNEIQIAFKPHPHLYPVLCNIWGYNKTNNYYKKWQTLENGMLCEADNYSLFKSSDALIHDCGSFIMEYLYTGKPCMYLKKSGKIQIPLDEQGQAALSVHYLGYCKDDINYFINEVVINRMDFKCIDRQNVFKKYVIPKNGKTATENILSALKSIKMT